MADYVQLVVKVDRTQLDTLQRDVHNLQGLRINLQTNGAQGFQDIQNRIGRISTAITEVNGEWNKTVTNVRTGIGQTVKTVEQLVNAESGAVRVTRTATENLDTQARSAQRLAQQVRATITAYDQYMRQVRAAAGDTRLQRQINSLVGIDRDYSPRITAQNSMFGRIDAETFRQYTSGAINAAQAMGQNTRAQIENARATAETAKQHNILNNVLKFSQWYFISGIVSSVTRAFREAIQTMKDVDSELVTVRKVTGMTSDELAILRDRAYEVASAYGVTADQFVASVAAFARAGYKEQSADLAELAIKTQLVGDTTEEVADQFLISVDAAYKYNGEISKLTAVLDGANEIDNKYATSIEKIASGIGIVAPVAAQAHVSIEELTAAIGTITAVTQRSGTEAARALRALFLNIIGDTKTEIDEGVTWTTGEIAGLKDVIREYAGEAYNAAQATGQVIDPMEAIAGLAQSMKDGLLTEQQLMAMVSDIGGKLRSSQLLAIIQNWDMYQSMLGDYADAIGSADREVENALDSWERKTNILQNTWTQFISHFLESGDVKRGLDLLIGAVKVLDNDFARSAITMGALSGASVALAQHFGLVAAGATAAKLAIGGFTAAGYLLILAIDAIAASATKEQEQYKQMAQAWESAYGKGSELDELRNKTEQLTEKEKARLAVLEAEAEAAERQLKAQQALAFQEWRRGQEYAGQDWGWAALDENGNGIPQAGSYVNDVLKSSVNRLYSLETGDTTTRAQLKQGIQDITAELKSYAEAIQSGAEAGEELTAEETALLNLYNSLIEKLVELRTEEEKVVEKTSGSEGLNVALKSTQQMMDEEIAKADELKGALETLKTAEDETNESGHIHADTMQTLLEKYPDLVQYINWTEDGYVTAKGALDAFWEAERSAVSGANDVISAEALKRHGYDTTTMSIRQQLQAMKTLYAATLYAAQISAYEQGGVNGILSSSIVRVAQGQLSAVNNAITNFDNWTMPDLTVDGPRTGGHTPTSTQQKEEDPEEKAKKEQEALLKELKTVMDAQLKAAQAARDAQLAAIDDQINALKRERDTREDQLTLEEKILAVQKAQAALANAQAERTVRQYNAQTGMWEWVANAKNVQSARDSLTKAEDALSDYRSDLAYEAAVAAMEAKKDAINASYDAMSQSWAQIIASMQAPSRKIDDVLSDIANKGTPEMKANVDKINALLAQIGSLTTGGSTEKAQQQQTAGAGGGGGGGSKRFVQSNGFTVDMQTDYMALMQQAAAQGNIQGAAYYEQLRNAKIDSSEYKGKQQKTSIYSAYYDSGGILHGLGGIKATTRDEIVLPPGIAEKMLSPNADGTFAQRVRELGYLYGAADSPLAMGGRVDARIGTQNNGDRYQFGNLVISESDARTMTVKQLADRARNLTLYKRAN